MVRYTALTGDDSHAGVIATTFGAAQRTHAGFVNDYYDDNAWWAVAWVAAFDLTRDTRYLDAARAIFARNAAAPGCDEDQAQFKGIFVRYLYDFWLRSRQPAYRAFILANAGSVRDHSGNASGQFGLRWAGPFDQATPARQGSALDALIAAAALST